MLGKMRVLALTMSGTALMTTAVSALPVQQALSLSAGETKVVNLPLAEGDYLRGQLSGNGPIQALIVDANGEPVRYLTRRNDVDARVAFRAPEDQAYQLRLSAADTSVEIKLVLEKAPLLAPGQTNKPEMDSPRVREALASLGAGHPVEQVWSQLTAAGTPLVEWPQDLPAAGLDEDERLVTFLWRGARERVLLLGAPGYEHDPLFRLGDSDIWFRSYRLPSDARMSYKLAPDVPQVAGTEREQRVAIMATAQKDPTNPDQWSPDGLRDAYNTASILELDQAPSDRWLRGDQPLAEVRHYSLSSERLGNTREVDIWLPEGIKAGSGAQVPLAIFFDGAEYQSRVPTPRILANLIGSGQIPPTVAIFVSNPSQAARRTELPCNADFADFMAQELLPFVVDKTGLSFTGDKTLLAGASFGGLASACTAYRYPQQFGLVLSQSGSFWWSPANAERPEWLNAQLATSETLPIRFYLSAGRFETDFGESGILNANRQLEQILQVKGYPVKLDEFSAGHDYFHWRATLGQGLVYLLGNKNDL